MNIDKAVPEFHDDQALARQIDGHVVNASSNAGEWDRSLKNQGAPDAAPWLLPGSRPKRAAITK